MITKKLAEEIIHQTMVRLQRNLNVMDTNGMILASGESARIENIHEGAVYVAKTGEILWITEENLSRWHGAKLGVNMPIHFQNNLVGVIGITGNPKELEEIATLVQLTTEMMVHQSLITSHVEWQQKIKELIFEELIGREPISSLVKERLSLLAFNATSPFVTLLIQSNNVHTSSQRIIEQLEEQFEQNTVLIGHSELNELFILTSKLDKKILDKKIMKLFTISEKDSSVRIGVGHSVMTVNDIHYSYETAKNALQFSNHQQKLVYYEDVELLALLKRNPSSETIQFSTRILNGINEQLRNTLHIYFSYNQNSSAASEKLAIHRHTIAYRLKKVEEITGYNPSLFQDAMLLKCALLLDGYI